MSDGARFVAAVVILVFRGGRLLAMRRSAARDAAPGEWEAVSGRIRRGEQPIEAARREAREETGLVVELDPDPIAAYQAKRGSADMVVIAYRGRSASGAVRLSGEHDAFAWMTLAAFAGSCRFPALVSAARRAAGRPGGARGPGAGSAGRARCGRSRAT
ncbi:MAG: NUDIX domain-containing protein [Acidobacteriota bacterium]